MTLWAGFGTRSLYLRDPVCPRITDPQVTRAWTGENVVSHTKPSRRDTLSAVGDAGKFSKPKQMGKPGCLNPVFMACDESIITLCLSFCSWSVNKSRTWLVFYFFLIQGFESLTNNQETELEIGKLFLVSGTSLCSGAWTGCLNHPFSSEIRI